MKAKQAIDLLENGIMPCVLSQFNGTNNIKYICGYYLISSHRGSSPFSYRFITLNRSYLFANDLNEEISLVEEEQ